MKRIQAEYPFDDYWLYVVVHKQQKRRMANLVRKDTDSKERITISFARYLMSVSLKRFLTESEHVDHIDDDKMNDSMCNLQILTPEENRAKEMMRDSRKAKYVRLSCAGCCKVFDLSLRNYKSRSKNGNNRFFCKRECYNSAR